jgi:hypothetical protein
VAAKAARNAAPRQPAAAAEARKAGGNVERNRPTPAKPASERRMGLSPAAAALGQPKQHTPLQNGRPQTTPAPARMAGPAAGAGGQQPHLSATQQQPAAIADTVMRMWQELQQKAAADAQDSGSGVGQGPTSGSNAQGSGLPGPGSGAELAAQLRALIAARQASGTAAQKTAPPKQAATSKLQPSAKAAAAAKRGAPAVAASSSGLAASSAAVPARSPLAQPTSAAEVAAPAAGMPPGFASSPQPSAKAAPAQKDASPAIASASSGAASPAAAPTRSPLAQASPAAEGAIPAAGTPSGFGSYAAQRNPFQSLANEAPSTSATPEQGLAPAGPPSVQPLAAAQHPQPAAEAQVQAAPGLAVLPAAGLQGLQPVSACMPAAATSEGATPSGPHADEDAPADGASDMDSDTEDSEGSESEPESGSCPPAAELARAGPSSAAAAAPGAAKPSPTQGVIGSPRRRVTSRKSGHLLPVQPAVAGDDRTPLALTMQPHAWHGVGALRCGNLCSLLMWLGPVGVCLGVRWAAQLFQGDAAWHAGHGSDTEQQRACKRQKVAPPAADLPSMPRVIHDEAAMPYDE